MDFTVLIDNGDTIDIVPAAAESPMGELKLSVLIPLEGWWQSPAFGNAMPLRHRVKFTSAIPARLEKALKDCTSWLLRSNRASKIDVQVLPLGADRLKFTVTAHKGGRSVVFEQFYDVSGGNL